MPKQKTRRGAMKRFKAKKSGKVKMKKSKLRHILTSKSTSRKRHLRKKCYVSKADLKRIKKLLLKS